MKAAPLFCLRARPNPGYNGYHRRIYSEERMEIPAFIVLGLFSADTAAHLAAIAQKKEKLRRFTKVLLMPLLALTFSFFWVSLKGGAPPWLVVAGLLLGCVGDTLLLYRRHRIGFPLGLASFSAGHVLYIVQIWWITAAPAWWVIALPALACVACVAVFYRRLRPFVPNAFRPAALFYMLLLSALSVSAAAGAIASLSAGTAVLLAGTLLFMLSDGILSFDVFRDKSRGGNLKVMIPYIAAQTLIAAGFFLRMR
jgi:uncharacterized membrane protein YhhN